MFASSSPEPLPLPPLADLLVAMGGDVGWWMLGVCACVACGLAAVALLAKVGR